uniref:Uncharacterized protein n=1 Tax=Rhizophora mucronata TaxID=61149 RepID=A0A2P2N0W8_RHIMU
MRSTCRVMKGKPSENTCSVMKGRPIKNTYRVMKGRPNEKQLLCNPCNER